MQMLRSQLQGQPPIPASAPQLPSATNLDPYTPFVKGVNVHSSQQLADAAQQSTGAVAANVAPAKASSTDHSAAHVLLSLRGK